MRTPDTAASVAEHMRLPEWAQVTGGPSLAMLKEFWYMELLIE